MAKFGLWYVKWDSSSGRYTSRLKTLNKSSATVEDFKERFDIAVVTTLGGFDAKNSGNGYEDGKELATFTKSIIGTGVDGQLAYHFGVTLDVVDEVFDYYLKRMGCYGEI
ncbi:hypothetical protein ADU37_CDS09220 [Thermococcus sp. 2319x1]|uniref:hypothetical protein n=1 Tax=Thermococcus sp. 2319x1 TaxID=1674923 RepID=UPI00073A539F|nr:hypothetical protein [Thermococcus sp. 2319x1]ALV62621.1 hypothetical protein ADU37_CDS09220 [Thermococcus sp. 2319x1]